MIQINVKWFGAKGDGVTNDTVAVQTALDAGGDSVYFPKSSGSYMCGNLIVPVGLRSIHGDGVIEQIAAGANLFSITSNTCLSIRNLSLVGVAGNTSASSNNGIIATSCSNIIIDGVRFSAWRYNAIYLKSCSEFVVTNCAGTALSQSLVRVQASTRGVISNNTVSSPQFLTDLIIAITLESTIVDANGIPCTDIRIANNLVSDYQNGQGIHAHAGKRISIIGNIISNTGGPIALSPYSLAGAADLLHDIVISGNVCEGVSTQVAGFTSGYGIWAAGGPLVTITNVAIIGNSIRYGGYSSADNDVGGIGVQYSKGVSVVGNSLRDCRSVGVGFINTNVSASVVGNVADSILLGRAVFMYTDAASSASTITARSNKVSSTTNGYTTGVVNKNIVLWDDNSYSNASFNQENNTVCNGRMPYTAADTSPTVRGAQSMEITNAGPISITTFDDGFNGQVVALYFTDSNTTLVNGSFTLNGAVNYNPPGGSTMLFILRSSTWYEISRGP